MVLDPIMYGRENSALPASNTMLVRFNAAVCLTAVTGPQRRFYSMRGRVSADRFKNPIEYRQWRTAYLHMTPANTYGKLNFHIGTSTMLLGSYIYKRRRSTVSVVVTPNSLLFINTVVV